jgi:hypothetical protein
MFSFRAITVTVPSTQHHGIDQKTAQKLGLWAIQAAVEGLVMD